MSNLIKMNKDSDSAQSRTVPFLLQREETAAQIVGIMQSRFDRPSPDEMRQILKAAEQQITGQEWGAK